MRGHVPSPIGSRPPDSTPLGSPTSTAPTSRKRPPRGEIDFDDILLLVCHIMDDFPEAAAQIRSTIGWLTVDEYQDVSPLQHRLLILWLGGGYSTARAQ